MLYFVCLLQSYSYNCKNRKILNPLKVRARAKIKLSLYALLTITNP